MEVSLEILIILRIEKASYKAKEHMAECRFITLENSGYQFELKGTKIVIMI